MKDNVHIRLDVHGSAFECPGKCLFMFQIMNSILQQTVSGDGCHNSNLEKRSIVLGFDSMCQRMDSHSTFAVGDLPQRLGLI